MDDLSSAPILALFGPTSSGKTRLSVELALRLRAELGVELVVISADSRQVYRYMDIGTSKTTPEEMRGVVHEMIDIAEPVRKLELESYVDMARERMRHHLAGGRLPCIVGGTGTYVSALVEGWNVRGTGSVRASLLDDFPADAAADAHAMLHRLDRRAAERIDPRNHEAVINALTRLMTTSSGDGERASNALVLGLDPGPKRVERAIEQTLDHHLEIGLLDEVAWLADHYRLDRGPKANRRRSENQVLHTHGYREFFELADRRRKRVTALTRAEHRQVRAEILEHIRAYSRRQRSWFAKLHDPKMVSSAGQAFELVRTRLSATGGA